MEIKIMVNLILFCLAAIGLTHIMVDSKLFEPLRQWIKNNLPEKISYIASCYQCSGMWTGILMGWFVVSNNLFIILACGFAGSFLSNFAAIYLNYLEAKTIVNLKDDSGN